MLLHAGLRQARRSPARQASQVERRSARPAAAPRTPGRCACGGDCPRCLDAALQASSHAIDPPDRHFLERRLGHDFGAVRLHRGPAAEAAASALGARAWTLGRHVVLGRGAYRPGDDRYRHLLAHELVHVLQQPAADPATRSLGRAGDAFEREADQVAAAAMSPGARVHRPHPVSLGPAAVRAKPEVEAATTVYENLAWRIVTGGKTAGLVLYKLNDKWLNLASNPNQARNAQQPDNVKANARDAIKKPEIALKSKVGEGPGSETQYEARIKSVPSNKLSREIHTPEAPASMTPHPPPQACWETAAPKIEVYKKVDDERLWRCKGTDLCQFMVVGRPDSATVARETEVHENRHAEDIAVAFRTVLEPWEAQLQKAKDRAEPFSGTLAQVRQALWGFVGKEPDAIADDLVDEVNRLGKALHAGLDEPELAPKDPFSDWPCSMATVYVEGVK